MGSLTVAEDGIETFFGIQDENLRRIERAFKVTLSARGRDVRVAGDDPARVEAVERLVATLSALLERGYRFRPGDVQTAIRLAQDSPETSLEEFFMGDSSAAARRIVQPRTANQALYLKAMQEHDIVISIGPAGTGKTYLAVAEAAAELMDKKVRRIVLCRPAVEAGERLGFLPGDLAEKVNPYLRPLYDALNDLIGFEKVARMLEKGVIEVAPIAFMRGRTLNESFVILDEAQNTTSEQMKMFLTRLGNNSKAVVNGDITQVDLPAGRTSGLRDARDVLQGVEGIKFVHFDERDVVRHELVQRIVGAYERQDRSAPSWLPCGRPSVKSARSVPSAPSVRSARSALDPINALAPISAPAPKTAAANPAPSQIDLPAAMRDVRRSGSGERSPERPAKATASHRHGRARVPARKRVPAPIELVVQNPRRYVEAADPTLVTWLSRLVESLAPGADSFGVRCVSDREMRRLNLAYRTIDATTDVLSFPGARTREGWHLGDVVLSVPQTRKQAAVAGHEPGRELRLLLLHGVLHCLGYDHEQDDGVMERLERRLRRRWLDGK